MLTQAFQKTLGRRLKAPENFLGAEDLERARLARRSFMAMALAMRAGSAPFEAASHKNAFSAYLAAEREALARASTSTKGD